VLGRTATDTRLVLTDGQGTFEALPIDGRTFFGDANDPDTPR
jgi:hypothetical protein